ncbi:hypothetical protein [Paludisphaera rhizosphaerae]|uniref:hypothetical protein n=1 Tax=Paludisphaera rhizosphaerae TaxID=2711216 RepID=UPI0013EDFE31|nr:hypothetical protein [Paludisphaera rhizosphaerae]
MLGLSVGVLAVVLASQVAEPSASVPPAPVETKAEVYRTFDVNGFKVPFLGVETSDKLGPIFRWDPARQRYNCTSPIMGTCPTGADRFKKLYAVKINGATAHVVGWVHADGSFNWCWDDQDSKLVPGRGATINPAGAMANGVDVDKLDGPGTVRASDPETAADVRIAMEAGNPASPTSAQCGPSDDASCIRAPDVPTSGVSLWLVFGVIAALAVVFGVPAFFAIVAFVIWLMRRKAKT